MDNTTKMIIISILTIIVLISLLFSIPKTRKNTSKFFMFFLDNIIGIPTIFLMFLLLLIASTGTLKNILLNKHTYTDIENTQTEKEIFSLDLNNEPNSFLLGVISLDSDFYFYFLVQEKNQYKLEKLNSESVYLEEITDGTPRVVYSEESKSLVTNYNPTKIGKLLGIKQEQYKNETTKTLKNTIYIPKGSIIKEHNPNLN